MKAITFKYTKADKKVSNRVLLISSEPVNFVSGTDISELEPADQVDYLNQVAKINFLYLDMLDELNAAFDVTKNYRQFKPEGMSDIIILK